MKKTLPGFQGKDAMREKAERILGRERESMEPTYSSSAMGRTHVRPYKKGGKVHQLTKEQTDLHLPKRCKTPKNKQELMSKAEHFNRGGKVKSCKKEMMGEHSMKKNSLTRKAGGGSVYEKEMIGEHPSKKTPHFNYSANMNGEKPSLRRAYAAGGAGKIRHHEATHKGKPMKAPRSRGR